MAADRRRRCADRAPSARAPTRCSLSSSSDLALTASGYLAADEHRTTNLAGVFVGGDIVRGSATVVLAMGDGKHIAATIDNYLRGTSVELRAR